MLLVISLFGDLFVVVFSLSAIVIYLGITRMKSVSQRKSGEINQEN